MLQISIKDEWNIQFIFCFVALHVTFYAPLSLTRLEFSTEKRLLPSRDYIFLSSPFRIHSYYAFSTIHLILF